MRGERERECRAASPKLFLCVRPHTLALLLRVRAAHQIAEECVNNTVCSHAPGAPTAPPLRAPPPAARAHTPPLKTTTTSPHLNPQGLKIEPFKHPITMDPNYADKTWKVLEDAIAEIHNQNASGLSFEELYR